VPEFIGFIKIEKGSNNCCGDANDNSCKEELVKKIND
jgi:hypothetical protein